MSRERLLLMAIKLCFGESSQDVCELLPEDIDKMSNQVKLPEFWPLLAQLWFARADAEFLAKNVTVEQKKYNAHVIASLPVEVAVRVSDEILSPNDTQPYTALRRRDATVVWHIYIGRIPTLLQPEGHAGQANLPTHCFAGRHFHVSAR